ncbi:hypothetical protein DFP72DRAFT_1165863 [Ephemerocybe angulata]|uniref:F-box domain-containing protein n=1 Tax=Ephemerocybe angulata TaxID=980116 RepID=A0A8H6I8U6_9AGAR|nr:hypothetical protein DFP72DRAFT_1165863 [Tulosesus angulatus]
MIPLDLTRVLSTNDAPSFDEESALTHAVVELEVQLESIQHKLRQHQGALSAIRRLPCEVLGRIFCHALSAPTPLTTLGREQLRRLGQVCRSWHEASLLEHQLWSSLAGDGGTYEEITTWLKRAGSLPKSLFLTMDKEYRDIDGAANSTAAKLLADGLVLDHLYLTCKRIGGVALLIQHLSEISRTRTSPSPWDTLRSLGIDILDEIEGFVDGWGRYTPPSHIFSLIPPVKSFNLCLPSEDYIWDSDPARKVPIGIPAAVLFGLTTFIFSCDWDGAHILDMLQHCANLEDLIVEYNSPTVIEDEEGQRFSPGSINLPNLRSLELRYPLQVELLDYIVTPRLVTLSIEWVPNLLDESISTIKTFIERSEIKRTLSSFRLHKVSEQPSNFISLFNSMPALTHLTLRSVTLQEDFWQTLGKRQRIRQLERLEVLEVPVAQGQRIIKDIVEFLQTRGRKKCDVIVSFPDPPISPYEERESLIAGAGNLEEFDIDLRVVRAPEARISGVNGMPHFWNR